jgi:hypothetical protein
MSLRSAEPRELPDEPRVIALIDEVLGGRAEAWKPLVELLYPQIERMVRAAPSMQPLRSSDDHQFNVVTDVLEKLQGKQKTYRGLALSVAWRAEFPHLRLGNWLHTVVVRAASSYVAQLLGQHHVRLDARDATGLARLAIVARTVDPDAAPIAAVDAVRLREVSIRYGKGEPWTPSPRPRHAFTSEALRFELELPPDRRSIKYVHVEYLPGREPMQLALVGGERELGTATTKDKANANKRLLHTLATELPADDHGEGFRPPVTDLLTNERRVGEALAWAAENLTPAQLRALLAWSDGTSFADIGRADAEQDPAMSEDGVARATPEELAKRGERLVRAARAKFDRKQRESKA